MRAHLLKRRQSKNCRKKCNIYSLSRVRKDAAFSYGKRTNLYKNPTKNSKIGLVSDEKSALKYVIFLECTVQESSGKQQELTVRHMCEAGGTKCKKQVKF